MSVFILSLELRLKYKSTLKCVNIVSDLVPVSNVEDYRTCGDRKPPYSYATLICMAMGANSNKMTLSAIYSWIRENFLYYRNADPSWQVKHNLLQVFSLSNHIDVKFLSVGHFKKPFLEICYVSLIECFILEY